MCTSLAISTKDFYFGRNMDIDYDWGEQVVITPRNYEINFTNKSSLKNHYSMIGIACVSDGYPLYADAVNEKGLCMAGLNFPGNAYYPENAEDGKTAVAPFELIPWVLAQCRDTDEAQALLSKSEIVYAQFNELPVAELHWHIADSKKSIVLERTKEGLRIYDNPFGVLANNPQFDWHRTNLSQYMNLTPSCPNGAFVSVANVEEFGKGAGSIGLPGDYSSASRFVKAAYLRLNSDCGISEEESVSQFFHILDSVAVVKGSIRNDNTKYMTTYSCCINTSKGIYYYKTYNNICVNAVSMKGAELNSSELISYPLIKSAPYCKID